MDKKLSALTKLMKLQRLTQNKSIILLVFFFILCRLVILLFYDMYKSDVIFYFNVARQGLFEGGKAYQDFAFGYPPLALMFTYIPAKFSNWTFVSYWSYFRIQMFVIDLELFAWIFYYLKVKLSLKDKQLWIFVGFYCLFGFLQGHLLYDRLDILIQVALFGILYFFTTMPASRWVLRGIGVIGFFVKFIPLLYVLPLNLISQFSNKENSYNGLQQTMLWLFKRGGLELIILIAPCILLLGGYQFFVADGLFRDLSMHFDRGIHVESIWAVPIIYKEIIEHPSSSFSAFNFGAEHVYEGLIPTWYLALSKYSGIVILTVWGVWLFLVLLPKMRGIQETSSGSAYFGILVWIIVFSLFLTTQRVLSPQFFLWLTIPLALLQALAFDLAFASIVMLIYFCTYIVFDVGYESFLSGNVFYVTVLAIRNLGLMALTVLSLKKLAHCGNPNAASFS